MLPAPLPLAINADEVEIEFHKATVEHIAHANKISEERNDEALKTWRLAEASKLWEQEQDEKELAWRNARRAEKAKRIEPKVVKRARRSRKGTEEGQGSPRKKRRMGERSEDESEDEVESNDEAEESKMGTSSKPVVSPLEPFMLL
jgi:hypothetical protein